MRAVVQRVRSARVKVEGEIVGEMGEGLLCLVAAGRDDGLRDAEDLAKKLVHLRIFADDEGRMNRSLLEVGGTLGAVSQFTLYGDTRKGRRPYFGDAAEPEVAAPLLDAFVSCVESLGVSVVTGRFGAEMDVELVNAGPVTLWIDTAEGR